MCRIASDDGRGSGVGMDGVCVCIRCCNRPHVFEPMEVLQAELSPIAMYVRRSAGLPTTSWSVPDMCVYVCGVVQVALSGGYEPRAGADSLHGAADGVRLEGRGGRPVRHVRAVRRGGEAGSWGRSA
jgi:hypothetical protein